MTEGLSAQPEVRELTAGGAHSGGCWLWEAAPHLRVGFPFASEANEGPSHRCVVRSGGQALPPSCGLAQPVMGTERWFILH